MSRRGRRHLAGLIFALLAASTAAADESCRIAFDMGSSGIRAGATQNTATAHVDIDFLGPLWAGRGLDEVAGPTVAALRDLPEQAGFPSGCRRAGGGFSAWRLAWQRSPSALAALLARIHAASGVAVLVMPQVREGAYGYLGARQLLGERLRTSHVLDIGGGSLQIAGEHSSFGETLGQKVWHRLLCQEIRNAESVPCRLQPMTGDELAVARHLAQEKLAGIATALPVGQVSLTAISRPVSRGVWPALQKMSGGDAASDGVNRAVLSASIEQLARLLPEEMPARVGQVGSHLAYLLSDMLLVEALLEATGSDRLAVAELDLTNLPGLLADDRLFAWSGRYDCYLERLAKLGIEAYASDPASCP